MIRNRRLSPPPLLPLPPLSLLAPSPFAAEEADDEDDESPSFPFLGDAVDDEGRSLDGGWSV